MIFSIIMFLTAVIFLVCSHEVKNTMKDCGIDMMGIMLGILLLVLSLISAIVGVFFYAAF